LSAGLASLPSHGRTEVTGAGNAVIAGLLFGTMYALLSQVQHGNAPSVIFVMRAAGTVALLPGVIGGAPSVRLAMRGAGTGILSGLASVGANGLFVYAVTAGGSKATLSVIAIALSAPAAMVIVNLRGRESLARTQLVAAIGAVASIGVLALVPMT
jgi:hypothetical protein